ncbi:MAG TPA: ribosomal L7Ae/L30e/S12e/Gadd45 family protein [Longimicrobiales bacterium]|nr:ribosomal L7Ae/L30e/S12e/Gadd45 family protein [Longimicrobiales bacterium]
MQRADRVLAMLGMAARAGAVVPGTERVREAARAGTLRLAVVAADASANSRDKLLPLLAGRDVPHVVRYSRVELGGAVGRSALGAVGIVDAALAGRLRDLLEEDGR